MDYSGMSSGRRRIHGQRVVVVNAISLETVAQITELAVGKMQTEIQAVVKESKTVGTHHPRQAENPVYICVLDDGIMRRGELYTVEWYWQRRKVAVENDNQLQVVTQKTEICSSLVFKKRDQTILIPCFHQSCDW